MPNNRYLVLLAVTLSTFFWGSNFNAGASVVADASPFAVATERFFIATIIIMIFMLLKDRSNLMALQKNWIAFIALGLLGITSFNLAFFIGLKTTSAINGALIMATSPITTALLAAMIDKHKITLIQTVGMLISLFGVVIVVSNGSIMNLISLNFSSGDLIIMLGNLAWATYTVGSRKYISNSTPLQTTTYTMLFGTIGILLFTVYNNNLLISLSNITIKNHLILVYMAVCGTVMAYLFWNFGIKEIGAANTAVFFNLVPVFTMMLALFTGSVPNLLQICGALIVICGVILVTGSYKTVTNH
ncbi:DMT family transporter [Gilliamella sp. B14384G15]|uniref:DMT family transporter n=1 Tax=unclassified Gilliamella TaxID=2685620 RepID=UPI0018DC3F5C|nr:MULTISPECIES: DMT family transporter [unclassified Gilliamella]MBI0031617.1 DMT family transporter [Gilliamella sp. B14384G15]MBI0058972.1 DMT family transporter [Gilliamella sp. B14384G12]